MGFYIHQHKGEFFMIGGICQINEGMILYFRERKEAKKLHRTLLEVARDEHFY